jgi:energy-coupling factor transport system permease protein
MTMKFQTVERDSIFTRLDFRPKLFMMFIITIVAFIWESPVAQAILCVVILVACLFSGVKVKYLRTILLIMLPFYVLLLLTHGFFNVDLVKSLTGKTELTTMFAFPESWWLIGGGNMSWEGFMYGINVILKTLTIILVVPLVIFTTDVDNMIVGMVSASPTRSRSFSHPPCDFSHYCLLRSGPSSRHSVCAG